MGALAMHYQQGLPYRQGLLIVIILLIALQLLCVLPHFLLHAWLVRLPFGFVLISQFLATQLILPDDVLHAGLKALLVQQVPLPLLVFAQQLLQ